MTAGNALRFVIRAAGEDDLAACLSLDHSSTSDFVWQVEAQESPDRIGFTFRTIRLPHPTSVAYPQEQELEAICNLWRGSDCFVVAEGEEGIYGYLTMRADRTRGVSWVSDLVVDRPLRRRRVGSALLQHARETARSLGLRRIIVETQTKNYPAICFCQRHGLSFCGFNDQIYPSHDIALFFSQGLR